MTSPTRQTFHRTITVLTRAATTVANRPALEPVARVLDAGLRTMRAPMRVAFAGRVSSGKSTLVNALVGQSLLPMGQTRCTGVVTELRNATPPGLVAHASDGTATRHPLADLSGIVTGSGTDRVLVDTDSPLLSRFNLIDTPGLASENAADAASVERTVAVSADDASADAVVLVFGRGLATDDVALVQAVQGLSFGVSPITTVGVLTRVEHYWPQAVDPMAEGRRVTELLMSAAGARRMLFELRPVCSLAALAASTLTAEEHEDLVALADIPPDRLRGMLIRTKSFTRREEPALPPPDRRCALFDRFSGYGLELATQLIRDGAREPADLVAELSRRTGLTDLRDRLANQFGGRRDLIKLRAVADRVRALPARMDGQLTGTDRAALASVVADVETLCLDDHGFQELVVLQRHYDNGMPATAAHLDELRQVSGEFGGHAAIRLGLPETTDLATLAARASERIAQWSRVAADPIAHGGSREVARVLLRSYERIAHHVDAARAHLEMSV